MNKFFTPETRLKINHLPEPLRRYSLQLVVVGLVACLVIILVGMGIYPSGSAVEVPEDLSPIHGTLKVPFSLIFFILFGFGIVAGALVYSSHMDKGIKPLLTRMIIGLLCVLLPLSLWRRLELPTGSNSSGLITLFSYLQLIFILLAFACGAATAISAFLTSPRVTRWAPILAAGSFFCVILAFVIPLLFWFSRPPENLVNEWNALLIQQVATLVNFNSPFVWIVGVVFFWQVITEVKLFSREIGLRISNLSDRFSGLLIILFVVKVLWLLALGSGLLGADSRAVWERSAQDGVASWVLSFLFAAATGSLLIRLSQKVSKEGLVKSAAFITGGFLFLFILAFIFFIVASLFVDTINDSGIIYPPITECFSSGLGSFGAGLACLSEGFADLGLNWQILFVALLIPLGLLLSRIERYRYLAPFFILAGMWSLPILIQVQFPDLNLAFQYLTFDISFTIVLILVSILAWQRKQLNDYSWRIVLMLVVSTLIALIGTLTQPVLRNFVFYSLLVIPFFYQLWFDSAELNTAGLSQGHKVVQTIGLQALLMVVVTWAVATGLMSPEKADWDAVAERLFLPPFLGLFLASMIGDKIKDDM